MIHDVAKLTCVATEPTHFAAKPTHGAAKPTDGKPKPIPKNSQKF